MRTSYCMFPTCFLVNIITGSVRMKEKFNAFSTEISLNLIVLYVSFMCPRHMGNKNPNQLFVSLSFSCQGGNFQSIKITSFN